MHIVNNQSVVSFTYISIILIYQISLIYIYFIIFLLLLCKLCDLHICVLFNIPIQFLWGFGICRYNSMQLFVC